VTDGMWKRSDDWIGTEVDGSFVMVNVESGKYVALNETAHAVWDALETAHNVAGLSAYLGERFEVEAAEDFAGQVQRTLETMREMGLILHAQ